jgi:metal-responsive CopG/Arc/MetJ family transcriptional regulator
MSEGAQQTKEKKKMKRVTTTLDEETFNRFWWFIKQKYNSPWRAFSREVRQAIVEYLDRHEPELTQQTQPKVQ